MFKKATSFIIAPSLLIVACDSQSSIGSEEDDGGFLWKVESGDTTVYLQGTVHIGHEDGYPLNAAIEDAFEQSDVVLPEIDINNIDQREVNELQSEQTYPEGTTLEDDLSAEHYEKLEEILDGTGADLHVRQHDLPFVMTSLLHGLQRQDGEYTHEHGVDQYFLNRAEEKDKEIRALESYEVYYEADQLVPHETHVTLLEEEIDNFDESEEGSNASVELWWAGDPDALADAIEYTPAEEEYYAITGEYRDGLMADQLVDILEEDSGQTYFVIAGGSHFVNTLNPTIIDFLEEAEYTVEHVY